jgi:hypothetical protein
MLDTMHALNAARAKRAAGQQSIVPTAFLPIEVVCIVSDLATPAITDLQAIRTFCMTQKILFTTREYDSYKNRHDRDQIERLPAFHVFLRGRYEKTFYPNTRPIQHIDEIIQIHRAEEERKKKRATRGSLWKRMKIAIKVFLHRQTRMERYQAEMAREATATAAQQKWPAFVRNHMEWN